MDDAYLITRTQMRLAGLDWLDLVVALALRAHPGILI